MIDAVIEFAFRYINVILLSSVVSSGAIIGLRFINKYAYRVRTRTLFFPLIGSFLLTLWISPSCFAHWISVGENSLTHIVCNNSALTQVSYICIGWILITGVSFTIAAIQGITSYCFSDIIIGKLHRTKSLELSQSDPLVFLLTNLSRKAEVSIPDIKLIESSKPQIFSTGRRARSCIYVSVGLLETLTDEEIEAVLAHEIAHISNGDSIIKVFASSVKLATAFNLLGFLIEPSISRNLEFLADENGAWLSGKPRALISALLKLSETLKIDPEFGKFSILSFGLITPQRRFFKIFNKHPPLEERLERLLELDNES
jgi:heat shock protein HtpX